MLTQPQLKDAIAIAALERGWVGGGGQHQLFRVAPLAVRLDRQHIAIDQDLDLCIGYARQLDDNRDLLALIKEIDQRLTHLAHGLLRYRAQ